MAYLALIRTSLDQHNTSSFTGKYYLWAIIQKLFYHQQFTTMLFENIFIHYE